MIHRSMLVRAALCLAVVTTVAGCGAAGSGPVKTLRIGAVFPLSGPTAADAHDEYLGAQLAAQMVDQNGGIGGRQITLDVRDVESTAAVQQTADSLRRDGVPAVIGAYSSQLSIPLAAAVARDGLVYWETGAVADQVTGQGQPLVFRVGASGANLGGDSGRFIVQQIAPRLHETPAAVRAFLVTVNDAYGHSVADSARASLTAAGATVTGEVTYDPYAPDWTPVIAAVAAAHPQILVLSSHMNDGIAFRRAFVAAHLYVDAFLGTTMAQCDQDFGTTLGPEAVGVFASDRPEADFNPGALDGSARTLYVRFAAAWRQRTGSAPTEEGLSGFAAAWTLFADALPRAHAEAPAAIAAAARSLDLPMGSLPNGAGVLFNRAPAQLGQNLRAAAVIWQWQGVDHSVVVWPAVYATGAIEMVPLPA
jgi:branched-chain amino acid transport system substrate-binding protein